MTGISHGRQPSAWVNEINGLPGDVPRGATFGATICKIGKAMNEQREKSDIVERLRSFHGGPPLWAETMHEAAKKSNGFRQDCERLLVATKCG